LHDGDNAAAADRDVHPFHPIIHGKEITEEEFRERVKGIHGLE